MQISHGLGADVSPSKKLWASLSLWLRCCAYWTELEPLLLIKFFLLNPIHGPPAAGAAPQVAPPIPWQPQHPHLLPVHELLPQASLLFEKGKEWATAPEE